MSKKQWSFMDSFESRWAGTNFSISLFVVFSVLDMAYLAIAGWPKTLWFLGPLVFLGPVLLPLIITGIVSYFRPPLKVEEGAFDL